MTKEPKKCDGIRCNHVFRKYEKINVCSKCRKQFCSKCLSTTKIQDEKSKHWRVVDQCPNCQNIMG